MLPFKRIFISDLHMSSRDAIEPAPGKHAYGWFSSANAVRLGDFLASNTVKECRQLFLVGDVIDRWICPHDVKPPGAQDILDAPHNKPVIDGIRAFADRPGNNVIWCRGNHDAEVTVADAHHISPIVSLVPHYDEFPLRIRHGHDSCLFNSPDPMGRDFPLGYFLSRFVATAAARGLAEVGLNLQLIWNSGHELVNLLGRHPLAECVFDAVCHAADINLGDKVIMPDGSTREVGEVRATYQNLIAEWTAHRGDAMNAVLSEWDPFYALPVDKPYLNIVGHSHERTYSALVTGGVYLNLGSWCGQQAHFAKTWVEDAGQPGEALRAQLFRWEPGAGAQPASTCVLYKTA